MIEQLDHRQFPEAAQMDFKQYWVLKLPDIESCIFPQTEKQIQSFFPLELTHQNKKMKTQFNRIYFVMVPKSAPVLELPLKFKAQPKKWSDRYRAPASVKKTTDTHGYTVYEWGVGFVAQ